MAQGRIFALDLPAGTNTTLYRPAAVTGSLTVRVSNRNNYNVLVRLALSDSATPMVAEWIEPDTCVPPGGVLECTGLVVGPGQYLVAFPSTAGVSAVGYGYEE